MTDLKGNRDGRLVCLLGLILAFATLACYWPVSHFDFINLDDPVYVYRARMVQRGLTWPGVVWAFKCLDGGNWNPLVWLSHMADCQFYGLKAGGHHVTNLVLHIANVLLLFLVLKSLTGAVWRSVLVAAIFALHPLHVESVAWVSERKDVLSTLFLFPALWAYAGYCQADGTRRKKFYLLSLLFFALGLMCKPMLVTLPLLLLLLDYWPLQRTESARKLILEKLPFIGLSAAASVLTIWTQHRIGAMENTAPLLLCVKNATVSYVTYLEEFFWPTRLAIFYPFPNSISILRTAVALVALAVISGAVISGMKKRRYLAVGWFWFLGTLAPVIGILQVGMQGLADRYTYIPYIGLGIMLAWGVADLAQAWPRRRTALAALTGLGLLCLTAATCAQVKFWRNSITVNEHAVKFTSGNYMAHSNLGYGLMEVGKLEEAMKQFQEVVRLMPTLAAPYNDIGTVYASQSKFDDAISMFLQALSYNPNLKQAHYNLGKAYLAQGKVKEAVDELKTAYRLEPNDINTETTLAEALVKTGKVSEAIPYSEAVVKADPEDAHARFALGWAYLAGKQWDNALANYKEAVRLAPDSPQSLNALAWVYATSPKGSIRKGAEAVRLAERACQITKMQNTELLDTLGAAYAETGRFKEAIKINEEIKVLAISAHDTASAEIARQRGELYKAGKPYRDQE